MNFAAVGVLFQVEQVAASAGWLSGRYMGIAPLYLLLAQIYQDGYLQVCLLVFLDQVLHETNLIRPGRHYHFQTVSLAVRSGLHFYPSFDRFLGHV